MAQMAPALTEANASPGSPRKNSVDRYCSSTVPEDLKQNTISKGVDLTLLSRNGLVRLLDDSDSSNNITNTIGEQSSCSSSPPKSSIRSEEQFTKEDMPNGHCVSHQENDVDMTKSANITADSQKRKPAIPTDLSRRACASSTATTLTPAGACNIESEDGKNSRFLKHPVASFDSCLTAISQRTTRSVQRQSRLENRAKKLEKRLRRLQTRQIETHVHRQLNGIVDQLNGKSESSFGSSKGDENCFPEVVDKKENLDTVKEGILSACALRSHETDNSAITYQAKDPRNASSTNNPTENQFENAVKYSPESVNKAIRNALSDERQKFETESLVEGLTAHVEHLEMVYDSDATEASSGDESEEEENRPELLRCNVSKSLRRAFQMELGEISSRWSWLQSQIINLERQIRRHEDLHKNVRVSKQPVKLQAPIAEIDLKLATPANGISTTKNSTSLSNSSEIKLNIFKEPQNHLRNGLKKTLLHNSVIEENDIPSKRLRMSSGIKNDIADSKFSVQSHGNDFVSQSARTRGICPIRSRPLVRLSLLQQKCKLKATSCQCSTPETPCISCTKTAKTITVVDPTQSVAERVRMLDQSYHPVLSFSTEIPLQFHFASILKKGGFESRTKPQPPKTSTQSERKKNAASKSSNRRAQLAKGAAASLLSSAKFRNQRYERNKRGYASLPSTPKNNIKAEQSRTCHSELPRKKRAAAISAAAQLQKRARSLSLPTTGSSSSTPTSSPSPTPLSNSMPQSTLGLLLRKKRTSNAFDINNIVIPYSMASSTRVEKLQYKEIPTPNWRVLEIAEKTSTEEHTEEKVDTETLDDDLFIERHEICEEHERKRFLGFLTKKRKRSQRQSSELGNAEDSQNTPPGTPGMMPSPTSITSMAGSITPTGGTLFSRSSSVEHKLAHRRSSSTDSLFKAVDVESWPTVAPFPLRSFPLTEAEMDDLKLPTPLPTPVPSTPASPAPLSPSLSPMCSPLASPSSEIDVNEKNESEKNEWTVKLVTSETESSNGDPNQPRKGIVLKLAKR